MKVNIFILNVLSLCYYNLIIARTKLVSNRLYNLYFNITKLSIDEYFIVKIRFKTASRAADNKDIEYYLFLPLLSKESK